MYYRLGRAGRALDRFGVIEFATTIAPGVRDVLLTGKVYEAVQRNSRNKGAIEYDAVVLDAPPTGRITQFLNVSDELAGTGEGRADQEPGRHDDDAVPVAADRRAPRHRARGDAGAGDRRRHRPRARGRAAGRAASSSTWSGPATCGSRTSPPPARASSTAEAIAADLRAAGVAARERPGRRAARRGPRPRRTPRARGRPAQAGQGARRPDLRAAPAGRRASTWAASTSSPPRSATRGWHDAGADPGRPAGDAHATSAPALDVDALLDDPQHRHHRLLRLGRRRQDHHLGGARAPGGRARPQGRRAHHRPGPPAGAVDGDRGARQHPAAGRRHRVGVGGLARRDDARHEADLRRGRGEPGHAREGQADPREPLLHRAVELVRRHPGVHGDGEARPAPARRRTGTAPTT